MIKCLGALSVALAGVAEPTLSRGARPDWAYAIPNGPVDAVLNKDETVYSLPGSPNHFTINEINGRTRDGRRTAPADWYPQDHPPMPRIVAEGDPSRGIVACAACHDPNGKGRPQNAGLAGLSEAYLIEQLNDMKKGLRHSGDARKVNAGEMVGFATAMSEAEIRAAADYFSSLHPVSSIRVVETRTVVHMQSADGMWLPSKSLVREPIGERIIETPRDVRRELLRDPRAVFIAFVPQGALEKGRKIVTTGAGKTLRCAICHGERLSGIGPIPAIAGRSPSYVARQLYDIQQGTRHGEMAALMKPVVEKLNAEDIVNIAAYVASLPLN